MKYELIISGKPVHPVGGKPYVFFSRAQASAMGNLCYGSGYQVRCIETGEVFEPIAYVYIR